MQYHPAMNMLRQITEAAEEAARMAERLQRDLEPFLLTAARQADAFRTMFPPEQLARYQRIAAEIEAAAQRRREEEPLERELFMALADRGWVGLENHLSADGTQELLMGFRENGGEWLDSELCAEARADNHAVVKRIVADWWAVPYLADRRLIIEDAIRAHEEGRYALSIPALMPLVDGLTAEIVGVAMWREGRAIYAKQAAEAYRQENDELWSEVLLTVITDQVFKPYTFGSDFAPSMINRHGILHGRISAYATEPNSLRTVLLIDIFARFATERAKQAADAPRIER